MRLNKLKQKKCHDFLIANGWIQQPPDTRYTSNDYDTYINGELCAIDMNEVEIVLTGGEGDFCTLPINYFALIGALLEYRQISTSYISVLRTPSVQS